MVAALRRPTTAAQHPQLTAGVVSGSAADWLGIDGLLLASVALLVVALVPLRWLRDSEHLVGRPRPVPLAEGTGG